MHTYIRITVKSLYLDLVTLDMEQDIKNMPGILSSQIASH